ncbi:alpha/beta hydrolase [Mycobacterium sherrisii]|uniref:Esterase n=1 Tax=Mycobacterium sherrisii TaxID=243061 RepID=A0A1E3SRG6_9MYCO|nr:alpha/beta fold hydrolase [Mycobacterium sherrisii]MCV7028532.1 alpha/beta fold hydrolase [Mycobacterium sherrisii]MEC4765637.1 alpha/beta fold hydrolase [Mycobacterium sherrisii]ODR04088.1 esterase [Mycobacterium sherrisii]ORW71596.1 esterase [Mycobacterium sherrisii]
MQTTEYAPGRLADIYGDSTQLTILVWHGMQANARTVLRPLAGLLAEHGAGVVVPDWDSHADDGGRAALLQSVEFVRQRTDDVGFALVGWSMGGLAAAGLTLAGVAPVIHTVCLAGAFIAPDPITGAVPGDGLVPGHAGPPFTLLHGRADDVVPVAASRDFAARLEQAGWVVELAELEADHGSIAGADYDAAADRYLAGASAAAQRGAVEVAGRIMAQLRYE